MDALESARLVEQHLAVQFAALGAFREPLLTRSNGRESEITRLATYYSRIAPGLRDLLVADSAGRVLYPASVFSILPAATAASPMVSVSHDERTSSLSSFRSSTMVTR